MPRRGNVVVACTLLIAAGIAVACVGEDPTPSSPSDDAGGSSGASSGASSGGSSGGSSGATTCKGDEPTACGPECKPCPVPLNGKATCTAGACGIECDASTTKCGDKCAVLGGDGDHCGACDHSCGGGACLQGACQPVPVVQGLVSPKAFDVGPNILVYTAGEDVASCALPAGCTSAAPKKIAEGYEDVSDVAVSDTDVFWISGTTNSPDPRAVRRCPLTGCVGAPTVIGGNDTSVSITNITRVGNLLTWHAGSNGRIFAYPLPNGPIATVLTTSNTTTVATDGTSIFFNDEKDAPTAVTLFRCAPAASCTPTTLSSGNLAGPMAIQNGLVFVAKAGVNSGGNDGKIFSTPAAAAGAVTTIRSEELSPIAIAADADGVYWANTNLKHVRSCPLTGCVGAPRDHGLNQTGVKRIRVDAKFVYWMTNDAIYKVAK